MDNLDKLMVFSKKTKEECLVFIDETDIIHMLEEYKPLDSMMEYPDQIEFRASCIRQLMFFANKPNVETAIFFDRTFAPMTTNEEQLEGIGHRLPPLRKVMNWEDELTKLALVLEKINIYIRFEEGNIIPINKKTAYLHLRKIMLKEQVNYAPPGISTEPEFAFRELIHIN